MLIDGIEQRILQPRRKLLKGIMLGGKALKQGQSRIHESRRAGQHGSQTGTESVLNLLRFDHIMIAPIPLRMQVL